MHVEDRIYQAGAWREHVRVERGAGPNLLGRVAFAPDGMSAAVTTTNSSVRLIALAAGCKGHVVQLWELGRIRAGLGEMALDW